MPRRTSIANAARSARARLVEVLIEELESNMPFDVAVRNLHKMNPYTPPGDRPLPFDDDDDSEEGTLRALI